VQEFQALGPNLSKEKVVARHISARPSEAGDKALLDGVVADTKHDISRTAGQLQQGFAPGEMGFRERLARRQS
jgi:hypothetical protein